RDDRSRCAHARVADKGGIAQEAVQPIQAAARAAIQRNCMALGEIVMRHPHIRAGLDGALIPWLVGLTSARFGIHASNFSFHCFAWRL
ncbi:MAG: hypothetical protein WA376_08495, partial [Terrimicrobiaceae bacterium]